VAAAADVAIVADAANHVAFGFGAATGAWTFQGAGGLSHTDQVLAGDNVGVVADAANRLLLAFRSSTGVWVTHAAPGLTNADKVAV